MVELDTSLHKFNPNHFGTVDDFLKTAESNERDTLMIACADHGTAPDNVSFAGPDRFFILQHLAASIPPPDDSAKGITFAEVQYAFLNYEIKHIVVCGHLSCGVIPNWLKDTNTQDTGGLRACFRETTVKAVAAAYPELKDADIIERLICEHAIFQLENLQLHPFIREKLDANFLKLHLWIVNEETARVLAFDPRKGDLVPIEEMR
jgi:carbonic anhydrase